MAGIMAPTFPSTVLIGGGGAYANVAVSGLFGGVADSVHDDTEKGRYNAMAKIQIETAKVDSNYVHLRFVHSNKYWSRNNDGFVVANSTEAEEDRTKPSCTLFEPVAAPVGVPGEFYLIHVQTGYRVSQEFVMGSLRQYVAKSSGERDLTAVDWGTVVALPPMVAFKGNNGKYLRYYKLNNRPPYMQFASDDPKDEGCIQMVEQTPNGHVRIKCNYTGGFWRLEPDWVIPDSQSTSGETLFQLFRGEDNKIGLKYLRNDYFCRSLTAGGLTDTLNARAPTMINEAQFEVEELVSNREIEVKEADYRWDQVRIFDEKPYLAGHSTVHNNTGQEATETVTISYSKDISYTFSRGFSTTASVSTTIKAGVPLIAEAGVTISFEITGTFNWDTTTSESQSLEASTTVTVPPRSAVRVNYVATRGTCSIPYRYTQRDRSSVTGQIVEIPQVDGIYTGVSCYNFDFQIDEAMPL